MKCETVTAEEVAVGVVKASADTFVDGRDSPNKNHSDREKIGFTETKDTALLVFDLSGVESVGTARLRLYAYDYWWREKRAAGLWTCGKFDPTTVTWYTKPSAGSKLVSGVDGAIPGWWEFSSGALTDYIRSNLGGKAYLLIDFDGADAYESVSGVHYGVEFTSLEKNRDRAPELVIG